MAANTRSSGRSGSRSSTAAKSAAGAAADGYHPSRSGTSDTTTETEASTEAPSTPAATARRRRTKQPAGDAVESSRPGSELPDLTVAGATLRDLEAIRDRDPALASSALAMSALALARELDSDMSGAMKSMCAKTLLDTMDRLRELCPPEQKADGLDDLAKRRAARRLGSAAS